MTLKLSVSEENYLKCIFDLSSEKGATVSTNSIAKKLKNSAASVTDMVKRLATKKLVKHTPYKGISLLPSGYRLATRLIRKHRLWETFLHDKLDIQWEFIHEIAEELEHIENDILIEKLDSYLGFPKYDPHGAPIPDATGKIPYKTQIPLIDFAIDKSGHLSSVTDNVDLLNFLNKCKIKIGTSIKIIEKVVFDDSIIIELADNKQISISQKVAKNLFLIEQK